MEETEVELCVVLSPAVFLSIRVVRAANFLENLTRLFSLASSCSKFIIEHEVVYKQGLCAFKAFTFDT